jgi:glycosyltransferase involved in cell wall biosynthesis
MKIAVISTMADSPWGGSEELWAAMVNEALNESFDVAVSVYRWPSTPPKILELQQKGVQILQRPHPGLERPSKGINKLISKVIYYFHKIFYFNPAFTSPFKNLFNLKPDVVCISQGSTYDSVYSRSLLDSLYKVSIPYVVVCQFNNDTQILNRTTQETAIEFFARASRVVFVSHHNMRVAKRQLAKILPNALVLQNPVNLSDLTVVPWPDSEIVCMASVARLDAAYKGQDVLFEALSSQVWQSRNWRLRLYGAGADKDYLEVLAKHYGISERVEFRGHVKDVRAIWLDNHLLVLPSRAEGTPLALVEAMICGRPAVVTDVGGNAEWVEELKTGFVAEAPTAKSFGAALERALLSQDDWKQMGVKAHEYATVKLDNSPGKSLLKVVLNALDYAK